MAITIEINKLTLCHKGDDQGTVTATAPDFCKTPPDAKPIAYLNTALAVDLSGGTVSVLVDGGNMAAHKASVFSKSTGDELGTLGGVTSGVHLAEASWLSYSMDVFLEQLNACRLTDQMLLNHGNTVSMGGFLTKWLKEWLKTKNCAELLEKIMEVLNGTSNPTGGALPPGSIPKGLIQRFTEQIFGSIKPGELGWDFHNDQIRGLQDPLADMVDEYDKWCGGGLPEVVYEYATKPLPNSETYQGPQPVPRVMDQVTVTAPAPGIDWGLVGAGVLLTGAAIILIFDPVPGDEVAAGMAAFTSFAGAFAH